MSFNYETSTWGSEVAFLRWRNVTSFRLRQILNATKSIGNNAKVLEVGCGAGQFISALKREKPKFNCFGYDISQKAIAAAKKRNDNVNYLCTQEQKLPYENDSFDAVLILDVLEHVEDPGSILREVARVLKSGGVFYCSVPCERDWTSLWNLLEKLNLKNDLTKKHAGHVQYFSRKSLSLLINKNGFSIKKLRFAEHVLGQLVIVTSYFLMERESRSKGRQINNEDFFKERGKSGFGKILKYSVNFLINLEARLLRFVPSPSVHLLAIKK